MTLDNGQAAAASTIAAEAIRLGLPVRAVTVALAAALQESGLQNLPYGDRDSVGLFQQRPSQGWGPRADLLQPAYAATAFYDRLVEVPGWAQLDPGVAAQLVQRSATPYAYTPWDSQAATLATVLTGQVPAGLACRFQAPPAGSSPAAIRAQAAAEFGSRLPATGWAAPAWLVAHAQQLGVGEVSYEGLTWTAGSGAWAAGPAQGLTFTVLGGRPASLSPG